MAYKQINRTRFDTYAEAKAFQATLEGRTRCRARPAGHFDVLQYKKVDDDSE